MKKIKRIGIQLVFCMGITMPELYIKKWEVDFIFFFQAFWTIEMCYKLMDIYL